jgi:hypothetical protein
VPKERNCCFSWWNGFGIGLILALMALVFATEVLAGDSLARRLSFVGI